MKAGQAFKEIVKYLLLYIVLMGLPLYLGMEKYGDFDTTQLVFFAIGSVIWCIGGFFIGNAWERHQSEVDRLKRELDDVKKKVNSSTKAQNQKDL